MAEDDWVRLSNFETACQTPTATEMLFRHHFTTFKSNDFMITAKRVKEIAHQLKKPGEMPSTKVLKGMGEEKLVLAIRKKYNGIVSYSEKIGLLCTATDATEKKQKLFRRQQNRKARNKKIRQQGFFKD